MVYSQVTLTGSDVVSLRVTITGVSSLGMGMAPTLNCFADSGKCPVGGNVLFYLTTNVSAVVYPPDSHSWVALCNPSLDNGIQGDRTIGTIPLPRGLGASPRSLVLRYAWTDQVACTLVDQGTKLPLQPGQITVESACSPTGCLSRSPSELLYLPDLKHFTELSRSTVFSPACGLMSVCA
eukprot:gene9154-1645_t